MHGAYITNDNFGHDGNSFDNQASTTKAHNLYAKV